MVVPIVRATRVVARLSIIQTSFEEHNKVRVAPDHTLRHIATTVHEPRTYAFLYVVYVVNLALDLLLIGMLRERLAEIRQSKLKPSKDYHFRLA